MGLQNYNEISLTDSVELIFFIKIWCRIYYIETFVGIFNFLLDTFLWGQFKYYVIILTSEVERGVESGFSKLHSRSSKICQWLAHHPTEMSDQLKVFLDFLTSQFWRKKILWLIFFIHTWHKYFNYIIILILINCHKLSGWHRQPLILYCLYIKLCYKEICRVVGCDWGEVQKKTRKSAITLNNIFPVNVRQSNKKPLPLNELLLRIHKTRVQKKLRAFVVWRKKALTSVFSMLNNETISSIKSMKKNQWFFFFGKSFIISKREKMEIFGRT